MAPEHLRRIIVLLLQNEDRVGELLGGPEWEPVVGGSIQAALTSEGVDHARGCWLRSAVGELDEATTGPLCVGEKYDLAEFCRFAGGQS